MSTPIFKGLHQIWPNAVIDVLVIPETAVALENNPHINKVYQFNKRKKSRKYFSLISQILKFRRNNYDIAFSIQSSYSSSLIMILAGIKNRVGYRVQKNLTHKITSNRSLHIRDRVLLFLKDFTDKKLDNETEVFYSTSDINKARSLLFKNNNLKKIAIAPGSVWATKKWPEKHFVELISKCSSYEIYLIGGSGDFELCESIIQQSEHANILNFAGKLSIPESCALIKEMDLVLSNDSAPLHMANAVKTNVFAIFGPTVKKFGCYPYRNGDKILEVDLACRPCAKHGGNKCPLNHHNCMNALSAKYVFKEIEIYFELINKRISE